MKPFIPGLRITSIGANDRFSSHPTRPPPKVILVIMPYADAYIYNRVKFTCDIKNGIRSICVVGLEFAKDRNDQYLANVALTFDIKLGGRNQILDDAKLGVMADGKTMVVGIDVYPPSPWLCVKRPSVAGIVASVDQWLGQWPADLQIQTARQEMVSGPYSMLKSRLRLRLWAKNNTGTCPENILIYRDGVSEGQYDVVLDQELPLLRRGCAKQRPPPRTSIVVVGETPQHSIFPNKERRRQ